MSECVSDELIISRIAFICTPLLLLNPPIGDSDRPCSAFNMAIIRGVEKVTHLIPESDSCLGEVVVQRACFNAPGRMLGLCMGFTTAPYVSTTEVYPDSPSCSDEVRAGM